MPNIYAHENDVAINRWSNDFYTRAPQFNDDDRKTCQRCGSKHHGDGDLCDNCEAAISEEA